MKKYSLSGTLHTDVLEEIYGDTTVHVMQDDDTIREVLLLDELQIARTYAITFKNDTWRNNKEIREINETIKKGKAIGKAFTAAGYNIQKNVLDVFLVMIPSWLQFAFDTRLQSAKARMTEFVVKKNDVITNYAIITELYAPDFRKPEISVQDKAQIKIPIGVLAEPGLSNEEIWGTLQKRTAWPHFATGYDKNVKELKEKVKDIMMQSLLIESLC